MSNLEKFTTAETDGTVWRLAELAGRRYVVVFGNRHAKDEVNTVVEGLQGSAETADLTIVQVAHLKGLPKPLRALATRDLRKGRERQLADRIGHRARLGLPADDGSSLRVAMDWAGEITDAFGFTGDQKHALTLFVDAAGEAVAAYDGDSVLAAAKEWVAARPVVG